MLKRTVLAIALTLIPLFTAVSTVKAASYYSLFDIFRYLSLLKSPETPTYNSTILIPSPSIEVISITPKETATETPTTFPTATVTVSPTPTPSETPTPTLTIISPTGVLSATDDTDDFIKNFIMQEINSYRSSQGLNEVKTDKFTCDFAKIRAKEISQNFNHDGFTNRINSKTLPYPTYSKVNENIALNSSYKKVVTQWKNSPGHADNMRAETPFVCVEKFANYYAYLGWKP